MSDEKFIEEMRSSIRLMHKHQSEMDYILRMIKEIKQTIPDNVSSESSKNMFRTKLKAVLENVREERTKEEI